MNIGPGTDAAARKLWDAIVTTIKDQSPFLLMGLLTDLREGKRYDALPDNIKLVVANIVARFTS